VQYIIDREGAREESEEVIMMFKDAKSIWYLKYQIPFPKKYLEKY